jgi:hypothetical protein
MKKIILSITLFLLTSYSTQAADIDVFIEKTNAFLAKYVVNNRFDYDALKKNTQPLDEIFTIGYKIKSEELDTDQFKAFWINTYNLCVIKELTSNYPIEGPLKLPGLFDKTIFDIGGKKVTLDFIEKKILSELFNDSRIHFALVCGAIGCPPLLAKAYYPTDLDKQLDVQTKIALNNPEFLRLDKNSKKVQISQIFEWYKDDFITSKTKEIDFINKYRDDKINSDFSMNYYVYDWNLNKVK